jgi:hypothetical protein
MPRYLVCFVYFVCLVGSDEPDKPDEPNKRDQANKPLHLTPDEMQIIAI